MVHEGKSQLKGQTVTRKTYRCPFCKAVLQEKLFSSPEIHCPSCKKKMTPPKVDSATVTARNERREKRCHVAIKVKYKTGEQFKTDYTKNVSRGGMFIRTTSPIEIGTKMQLALIIPELNEPITLDVEVVHRNLFAANEKDAGIGVKFLDINPESRKTLINYLQTLTDCP